MVKTGPSLLKAGWVMRPGMGAVEEEKRSSMSRVARVKYGSLGIPAELVF